MLFQVMSSTPWLICLILLSCGGEPLTEASGAVGSASSSSSASAATSR